MLLLFSKSLSSVEAGPVGGLLATAGGQQQGNTGKQRLLAHPLRDSPGFFPGRQMGQAGHTRGTLGLWDWSYPPPLKHAYRQLGVRA